MTDAERELVEAYVACHVADGEGGSLKAKGKRLDRARANVLRERLDPAVVEEFTEARKAANLARRREEEASRALRKLVDQETWSFMWNEADREMGSQS